MPNYKPHTRCTVCGAKFVDSYSLEDPVCSTDCRTILRTGKTMDDLVREASIMPRDIPDNNHDYDEFDLEQLTNQPRD
jgi:predicted nucleic acid-binding Zn ribbon protein